MNRRQFLKTGGAAALALSSWPAFAEPFADMRKRVGLIGTGWYGKSDLLRLVHGIAVATESAPEETDRLMGIVIDGLRPRD